MLPPVVGRQKGGIRVFQKGGIGLAFVLFGARVPRPSPSAFRALLRHARASSRGFGTCVWCRMAYEEGMDEAEGGYDGGFDEGHGFGADGYEDEVDDEGDVLDEDDVDADAFGTSHEFGNGVEGGGDGDDMFEEAMAAVDASLSEETDPKETYGRGAADLDDFDPYDIRAQERLELQRKSAEKLAEMRQEATKYLESFYSKRDEAVQKVAEENRVADQKAMEDIEDQTKTGWEKTIAMIDFRTDNKPKKGPADEEKKAVDMSKYKKLLFKLRERETGEAEE